MWLWGLITASRTSRERYLYDRDRRIDLRQLEAASVFGDRLEELRGRSVLLAADAQLATALALAELDGVARRIVLCSSDLQHRHLAQVANEAGIDAWVGSADRSLPDQGQAALKVAIGELAPHETIRRQSCETEWILLTSGTTGGPKLVLHTLSSLVSALASGEPPAPGTVWATFYDIRRYGGLQIFLRGVHAGSLVLSNPSETVVEFLRRAAVARVTHISGTPSHWRKALMSGAMACIAPRYIRLSGEIADQGILDGLRAAFPSATIAHAFATTEAGVGFEVQDGRAGFPVELSNMVTSEVEIDVRGGTLRLRSASNALSYLGANVPALKEVDGFVDTGDQLELRDGRYHFVGRRGGIINVGGLKVHPEEIEAVINAHPRVRMSRVVARRSPIMGAVVAAEVVIVDDDPNPTDDFAHDQLKQEITAACRKALAAHKVPVTMKFVASLEVSPSGKLLRSHA